MSINLKKILYKRYESYETIVLRPKKSLQVKDISPVCSLQCFVMLSGRLLADVKHLLHQAENAAVLYQSMYKIPARNAGELLPENWDQNGNVVCYVLKKFTA